MSEGKKKETNKKTIMDRIILGVIWGWMIIFILLEAVITDIAYNGDKVLYEIIKLEDNDEISIIDEDYGFLNNEEEYKELKEKCLNDSELTETYVNKDKNNIEFDSKFFENKKLLVLYLNYADSNVEIQNIKEENNNVIISLRRDDELNEDNDFLCIIPVSKNVENIDMDYMNCLSTKYLWYTRSAMKISILWIAIYMIYTLFKKSDGWKKVLSIDFAILCILVFLLFILSVVSNFAHKPIIYLYPTEETEVSVTLGKPYLITSSYPKYTNSWDIIASPNGDLKDVENNKNLYALYYENENVVKFKVQEDGFVVKGEEVAEFLEEKLSILGLTDREKEEFIIYWLPKLEVNKYNYIRFATKDEIDINMPLSIDPKPDSVIRVLMTYKKLNRPIKVEEQKLENVERNGFVVVEWGGTEIR